MYILFFKKRQLKKTFANLKNQSVNQSLLIAGTRPIVKHEQ